MIRRGIVFCCLLGLAMAAQAHSSCSDPELDRQWREAVRDFPADGEVVALAVMRDELCQMIAGDQIDANAAHLLWEKTITKAFIKRAQGARTTLLMKSFPRLFGTF